jgi:raffinose/stachyose/melibiose transport system substrate-binding protein
VLRPSEQPHPAAKDLDLLPTEAALALFLDSHRAAVAAVQTALPALAQAAALMAETLSAGRVVAYAGAGSSALMALADGMELPGTFGVDPHQVRIHMAGGLPGSQTADVTLTIESWRNDDLAIWQDKLIPAFEAKNPGIKVVFAPSAPTEYNAALNAKLEAAPPATSSPAARSTPRSSSTTRAIWPTSERASPHGELLADVAKSAWQTDDGKATFCVPMASVIHGFIYNKDAFDALGIDPAEDRGRILQAALDKIKADGTYIPLAMGTKDQWEAATMGYQNIGPNYWKGEEGRLALIKGEQKLTDAMGRSPMPVLAKWKDYLGDGFEAQTYPDSQNLFTLGRAAIYPAGSWEISASTPRPVQDGRLHAAGAEGGDTCYISDHTDIAIGMNAKTANPDEAKKFLTWVASPEFADHLRQRPAGLLQPEFDPGEDGRPAGAGIRVLARQVQVDDPLDLSDPVARHAEPGERDLGRIGQRDQRHRHA